jgi:hypothetical protein
MDSTAHDAQGLYDTDASWDGFGVNYDAPVPHIMRWCNRVAPALAADLAAAMALQGGALKDLWQGAVWGALHDEGTPTTTVEAFLCAGTRRAQPHVGEPVSAVLLKLLRTWAVVVQAEQPKPIAGGLMHWRFGLPGSLYVVAKDGAKTERIGASILARPVIEGASPAAEMAESEPASGSTRGPRPAGLNYWPPDRSRPWLRSEGIKASRPKDFPRNMPQFVEIAEPSLKRLRVRIPSERNTANRAVLEFAFPNGCRLGQVIRRAVERRGLHDNWHAR